MYNNRSTSQSNIQSLYDGHYLLSYIVTNQRYKLVLQFDEGLFKQHRPSHLFIIAMKYLASNLTSELSAVRTMLINGRWRERPAVN